MRDHTFLRNAGRATDMILASYAAINARSVAFWS